MIMIIYINFLFKMSIIPHCYENCLFYIKKTKMMTLLMNSLFFSFCAYLSCPALPMSLPLNKNCDEKNKKSKKEQKKVMKKEKK